MVETADDQKIISHSGFTRPWTFEGKKRAEIIEEADKEEQEDDQDIDDLHDFRTVNQKGIESETKGFDIEFASITSMTSWTQAKGNY